jgi:hypothetical protein
MLDGLSLLFFKTGAMAQASLSTGSRSHLLPAGFIGFLEGLLRDAILCLWLHPDLL